VGFLKPYKNPRESPWFQIIFPKTHKANLKVSLSYHYIAFQQQLTLTNPADGVHAPNQFSVEQKVLNLSIIRLIA
jgi:hypothetical protein